MTEPETPPLPFFGDPERTCPYCGREEPNEFLLANNHAHESTRAKRSGSCVAMDLTRNHLLHDLQQLRGARARLADTKGDEKAGEAANRVFAAEAALRRSVAHASAVWPDVAWITEALHGTAQTEGQAAHGVGPVSGG